MRGLGGRPRELDPARETARVGVHKAIKSVISKFRNRFGLPRLAHHLDESLQLGSAPVYRPTDPRPDWEF